MSFQISKLKVRSKLRGIEPGAIKKRYLLSDADVARFIVNGYHLVRPRYPKGLHETIAKRLDRLRKNPGDAITEKVPELRQILHHSVVGGVLQSLLGKNYEVEAHRHWHCKKAGASYMQWHQDSRNERDIGINQMLGLYYPRHVMAEMGPPVIVPGTHFRNAPTDRMATYTNIRGQVPLVVKAGTIALTHYDLWHGTFANRSSAPRHMVKFLFTRTGENAAPTWNHASEALDHPTDWNKRENAVDARNILTFSNPINVSQSDHYKERAIRNQCWDKLIGVAEKFENQ